LRIVALRVTLLTTETVLCVLLLTLGIEGFVAGTTTAAIRLGIIGGSGDIEKIFLMCSCNVGSLSL
jgi:hypothetical protein